LTRRQAWKEGPHGRGDEAAADSPNLLPGACDAVRLARQWSSVVAQVRQARSATTTPARAACGRGPGRVGQGVSAPPMDVLPCCPVTTTRPSAAFMEGGGRSPSSLPVGEVPAFHRYGHALGNRISTSWDGPGTRIARKPEGCQYSSPARAFRTGSPAWVSRRSPTTLAMLVSAFVTRSRSSCCVPPGTFRRIHRSRPGSGRPVCS